MYVVPPPQRSDPRYAGGSGDLRVYQTWKGSNIFVLQGRFIFGPDVRSMGLTIFLIVAPITVFCIFIARKLMDEFSHHLGVSIMVAAVVFTIYVPILSEHKTPLGRDRDQVFVQTVRLSNMGLKFQITSFCLLSQRREVALQVIEDYGE